jgi:hypothetical protein
MALDRLHLRKVRWNRPEKALSRDRRHYRRAKSYWKYVGLRPLRSNMWIIVPRVFNTRLRDFLRRAKEFEHE